MAQRRFSDTFSDLPEVNFPDWELVRRLGEAIEQYHEVDSGVSLFRVQDRRGDYTADNFSELERNIGAQEDPPDVISIRVFEPERPAGMRSLSVRLDGAGTSFGSFESNDEAIVHHLAARTRELFEAANKRLIASRRTAAQTALRAGQAKRALSPAAARRQAGTSPRKSLGQRILYDPWVVGIGTAFNRMLLRRATDQELEHLAEALKGGTGEGSHVWATMAHELVQRPAT
jgi:hypothetical protein